mgnify:CR=1 FL=1
MNDMHQTIIPKSDQLNADDLIGREMTIKITGVTITPGEQPVAVHFEGDNGKPYKACKSMCRVMVSAWGSDSKKYIGRSMTLYRDAKVKWGGMEVGGIRISHMSDIADDMTMALTVTRSNRKPFTVRPLVAGSAPSSPPAHPLSNSDSSLAAGGGANLISDADLREIVSAVEQKGIKGRFDTKLRANKIASPDQIPAHLVGTFKQWVNDAAEAK